MMSRNSVKNTGMLVNSQKRLCLMFLASGLLILYSYLSLRRNAHSFQFQPGKTSITTDGYLLDNSGCRMPFWDPFHISIRHCLENLTVPYSCERSPSFLIIQRNASVGLNDSLLRNHFQLERDSVHCTYRTILRDPGKVDDISDSKIFISLPKYLRFDVPLNTDFVHVKCYSFERFIHEEFLPLIPLKPATESRCEKMLQKRKPKHHLNVIIIGIDSISKLSFVRYLKKTREFLRDTLRAIELKGYNKVADNTFPNLVPMLTGHFHEYFWNESNTEFFFDDLNFIWKEYASLGYRTLLAEDAPNMAIFNYGRNGFRNAPTDYYLRPFSLAAELSSAKASSKRHCFQNRLEMKVVLDYAKAMADTMGSNRPFFSFAFAARLTHDELNYQAFADEPALEILQDLHSKNVTNNSLVILMSDHGLRFGPIRETVIGKYEERWPIMFLAFPDWFLNLYPQIYRNLRLNQERLTTPFDIHSTLLDLFRLLSDNRVNKSNSNSNGLSLFKEIPPERTCEQASILPHWCTCQEFDSVALDEPVITNAGNAILQELNYFLKPHSETCALLKLNSIKDARSVKTRDSNSRYREKVSDDAHYSSTSEKLPFDILVTVSVSPSGGLFEATVKHNPQTNSFTVLGDISRINAYGIDGDCVKSNSILQKYCYCIR